MTETWQMMEQWMAQGISAAFGRPENANTALQSPIALKDCFGEVVDLCLDGDVVVPFASSPDAPESKVSSDRLVYVSSGDTLDDEGDDFASNFSKLSLSQCTRLL